MLVWLFLSIIFLRHNRKFDVEFITCKSMDDENVWHVIENLMPYFSIICLR